MRVRLKHRHKKAAKAVGENGFARVMARHTALFFSRGATLIVSFDNMKSRQDPAPAYPWGFRAIKKAGHSHLAIVVSRRNEWFRHPDLAVFLEDLAEDGFFDRFERVVFYGASMGGYGALAYSAVRPGSDVVVFAPQTSLDPMVAPFETRYRKAFGRGDWSGAYADAAQSSELAARVTVFYDPYVATDAAHVARLPQHNLTRLECPSFGHNPARLLKMMGILGQVVPIAWAGDLDAARFARMRRAVRGQGQSLARNILRRAIARGHPILVRKSLDHLAHTHPEWSFPRLRRLAALDTR